MMKKLVLAFILLFTFLASYSQLTVSIYGIQHVSCFGGANGNASVGVTGGVPAYSYTWMPSAQSSSVATGLAAGQYTVWVSDAAALTGSAIVTISQPTALSASSTQTNVSCFGACNGMLNIVASGGTAPYSYYPFGSVGPYHQNICAGTYSYTVIDASNCQYTQTVTINQLTQITIVSSTTNIPCYGMCNGAASVIASGGIPPYSYAWASGSSSGSAANSNLCAGLQPVTITDAVGCVKTQTVTIGQPPALSASVTHTDVSCNGSCDGTAVLSYTGGVIPYNISWTNGGGFSTTFQNVCVGNYAVTVMDGNGCTSTASVSVVQSVSLTATIASTNVSCGASCNGSAHINVAGGAGVYTFSSQPPGITSANATNLCVGTHTISISDVSGCSYSLTTVILQAPSPVVTINTASTSCGVCNASLYSSASGGQAPYTYTWSQGSTASSLTGLCAGNYTLNVTDAMGCTVTKTTSVTNLNGAALQNATVSTVAYNETCYLTGDGSIDLTVAGTNPGPFTYQWSNGVTTQDITNALSGVYTVTVSDQSSACFILSGTVSAVGATCGTISGNVFIDANTDCIKNSGDNNYAVAMIIANPGNKLAYTNVTGDYTINNVPYGTYTVTVNHNNSSITSTCPATINAPVNAGTVNSINNNFALTQTFSSQPDMHGSVLSWAVVPGFISRLTYTLRNYQLSAAGLFKARIPSNFISTITTVSPSTYTLSADTIIWSYINISYQNYANYYIEFLPPVSMVLGSTFTTCATATTMIPDLNPPDNSFCYSGIVTGSFDPNDKTASPVGMGTAGNITVNDKELNYLIRFQNTGNGPAVNIVVKDTLSAYVDVMSLEMLSVSHNYKVDILPGNILRWKFDNIMLADSGSNEPASHGYIQYRIKQKANNPVGTQIKNTAYIYFDFNSPVITNTALNTIWEAPVGIEALSNTYGNWLVYPNPASNLLYIRNAAAEIDSKTQLELVNAMGQVLHTESFSGANKSLDLSAYASGVYFVKLITEEQSTIKRIVISR